MISVAALKTRLVWLGAKQASARHCCIRECRKPLPFRIGGRALEVTTFRTVEQAEYRGMWRYVGGVCPACAVRIRAYHYYRMDNAFTKDLPNSLTEGR